MENSGPSTGERPQLSSPHGPLQMAACVPSRHGSQLLPKQGIWESTSQIQCLLWPSLRSHKFPVYPIGYTGRPYSLWEGTAQGLYTRSQGSSGAILEARYQYWMNRKIIIMTANNFVTHTMCKHCSKVTINLWGRWDYLHFTVEETKAQRS